MKIAIIHGQNHKGSSYHMGRKLAEKLTQKENIIEFFLPRDLNYFCLGCYACLEDESRCPFWTEKKAIIDAMEQADLLIFTTPNYCLAPSASMKAFLDMMFDAWMIHKPKEWMFRKRAVLFSAAAGASCRDVFRVMKHSLSGWGIPEIKTYGVPVHAMNWEGISSKEKDAILRKLDSMANGLKNKGFPKIHLSTKLNFYFARLLHQKGWDSSPSERTYWQERGWLDRERPWKQWEHSQ